jgi:DNA sulfur modification protein DndD
MRLKYLVLSDIGPFRARHIFDFSTEDTQSGYAFFAKNGRGKTTIYNAMKWALFGKVRRKSKLVNEQVVEGSLKPVVDEQDEENMMMNYNAWNDDVPQSMSVLFVAEGEFGELQVERTASCKSMARKDKDLEFTLNVSLNGTMFQGQAAEEEIAKVFPIELERFFFIDGEEVEAYTTMMKSSSQGIIDDIKSILRLPSLTRGIEDFRAIKRAYDETIDEDAKQQRRDLKQEDKARTLHGQLKMVRKQIEETEEEISRLKTRQSSFEEQIKEVEELKTYVDEKLRVDSKIELLQKNMKSSLETFIGDFSNAGNILLWNKLKPMYDDLSEENDGQQNKRFALDRLKKDRKKIQETIDEFCSICDKCEQPVLNAETFLKARELEKDELDKEIKRLEGSSKTNPQELRAKLTALETFQPNHGSYERLKRSHEGYLSLSKQLLDLTEKQRNLADHVTEDSAKDIAELAKKSARTDQALLKKETALRDLRFREDEFDAKYKTTRTKDSNSEAINTVFELRDTIQRFIVAINDTVKSYSNKAREEVQNEASKVFLQLSNSPKAFSGIRLNKNFKASIFGSDGRPVVGASSGMEVIMTLSIIDALRTVSGLDAPVFFDTPARSLDKDHKNGMLNYFWRDDRSQFLIFAHSGEFTVDEIVNEELAVFNKAWELMWPEDLDMSCIHCWSKDVVHVSKHENMCNQCEKITDSRSRQTTVKEVEINE